MNRKKIRGCAGPEFSQRNRPLDYDATANEGKGRPLLDIGNLERGFTMDQACELIPMCRRKLQEFVKAHPFYYENGARKLFTETDIQSIRAAMRHHAETRRREQNSVWTEAQRRLAALRQVSRDGK